MRLVNEVSLSVECSVLGLCRRLSLPVMVEEGEPGRGGGREGKGESCEPDRGLEEHRNDERLTSGRRGVKE